jgi:2-succinyl-6-hydroxy-2,4-cyclohexadiene-1-carboxylate synthase
MLITLRDGYRMHAAVTGTGDPVVLVHGFAGSSESWGAPLLEHLGETCQVVAVDLLGHGKSDGATDPARYSAQEIVRDLVEVLDALSLGRAAWIGYSMGGRAALALAVEQRDRVTRMVLEGAAPGLEAAEEREARKARDDGVARLLLDGGIEAFAEHWRKLPVFASRRRLAPAIRADIKRRLQENNAAALAACLRGFGRGAQPSYWSDLGSLEIPVTLIVGDEDQPSRDVAVRMAEVIPQAVLTIVGEAGHTVHLEHPAAWLEAVRAALGDGR